MLNSLTRSQAYILEAEKMVKVRAHYNQWKSLKMNSFILENSGDPWMQFLGDDGEFSGTSYILEW